jgi:hypothetical protein
VFGGGDGAHALSDLFALDLMDPGNLRWQNLLPAGQVPVPRGYHTANLVGDKLVVFGGSDGHECFSDVHVCDLSKYWAVGIIFILFFVYRPSSMPLSHPHQFVPYSQKCLVYYGTGSLYTPFISYIHTRWVLSICDRWPRWQAVFV